MNEMFEIKENDNKDCPVTIIFKFQSRHLASINLSIKDSRSLIKELQRITSQYS